MCFNLSHPDWTMWNWILEENHFRLHNLWLCILVSVLDRSTGFAEPIFQMCAVLCSHQEMLFGTEMKRGWTFQIFPSEAPFNGSIKIVRSPFPMPEFFYENSGRCPSKNSGGRMDNHLIIHWLFNGVPLPCQTPQIQYNIWHGFQPWY